MTHKTRTDFKLTCCTLVESLCCLLICFIGLWWMQGVMWIPWITTVLSVSWMTHKTRTDFKLTCCTLVESLCCLLICFIGLWWMQGVMRIPWITTVLSVSWMTHKTRTDFKLTCCTLVESLCCLLICFIGLWWMQGVMRIPWIATVLGWSWVTHKTRIDFKLTCVFCFAGSIRQFFCFGSWVVKEVLVQVEGVDRCAWTDSISCFGAGAFLSILHFFCACQVSATVKAFISQKPRVRKSIFSWLRVGNLKGIWIIDKELEENQFASCVPHQVPMESGTATAPGADLPTELIELLEKIVLHNSDFSTVPSCSVPLVGMAGMAGMAGMTHGSS